MGLQECGLNLNAEQQELMPHGTLDFPCAGYAEELSSPSGDEIPWHWHDELEIICVSSGQLRVQIPAKDCILTAGDCLVINSGVLHSAAAQPRCKLQSLVFSPLLLTGSKDSVFARKYISPLTGCRNFRAFLWDRETHSQEMTDFMLAFQALAREVPGFEFIVREKLSALCYTLCRQFAASLRNEALPLNQDDLRIQKMLELIRQKYAEEMTLAEIAAAADIGERECLRCFGRTIRLSPMQYLLKYRIMRGAEALLQDPSGSIAETAAGCGFDSPSNFSRLFRRYYNCTPREFRRLHAAK